MDGQYWKGDRTMSTNEWLLTSDFWQFLEPWHGRWYEYEIFIASCTDNIYDLENERWLLGDMIDHVGIYGSRVAEGLSAFNVGLVASLKYLWHMQKQCCELFHTPHGWFPDARRKGLSMDCEPVYWILQASIGFSPNYTHLTFRNFIWDSIGLGNVLDDVDPRLQLWHWLTKNCLSAW